MIMTIYKAEIKNANKLIHNDGSKDTVARLLSTSGRQRLHGFLCRYFQSSREEKDILYTTSCGTDKYGNEIVRLYVQASEDGPELPGFTKERSIDISSLFNDIEEGDTLSYIITCIPHKQKQGKKRYISGVNKYEERVKWLKRTGAKAGVDITSCREIEKTDVSFYHDLAKGGKAHLSLTKYKGNLIIQDKETFKAALAKGFGPGKSYGSGLMLIGKSA